MKQPMIHQPVLLNDILTFVKNRPTPPKFFVDGTFGRGGHTRAIMNECPEMKMLGLDQDLDAIEYGKKEFANEIASGRLVLWHANFHNWQEIASKMKAEFGIDKIDGLLLDLGVSSPQLDEAERGFSFMRSGPLDMRMNRTQKLTAADIVNEYPDKKLTILFRDLGEVRSPFKVVNAIVKDRKTRPFQTTGELAEMIARVDGWKRKGFHPATQYFLALRMAVNNELDGLAECLPLMIQSLAPQGQFFVISFHSLEDRIAKNIFKASGEFGKQVTKKVIQASQDEIKTNTRSRSAKLRVFEAGQGDTDVDNYE